MPRRKKTASFPGEGDAFVFPLPGEQYGACRVLRQANADDVQKLGEMGVLVACSGWIGASIPDPADPSLRTILHVTHHSWKGQANIFWANRLPPTDFQSFGVIAPTTREQKMRCLTLAGWASCPIQLWAQWRWDHDREAMLKEEAIEQTKATAKRRVLEQEREAELRRTTLKKLARHKFFCNWKRVPSKEAILACRELMKKTVLSLSDLEADATEAVRLQILESCIEEFNKLDDSLGQFIETSERDDICAEFQLIVHACGLGHKENLADEWRDW